MDILQILGQSYKIIQDQIKGSEAENTSLYHDLSHWRFSNLLWNRSQDVMNILIAISFMGLPDDQQNKHRERAHKIAQKYKYEGQWLKVKEILDLQTTAPGKILQWYFTNHNPEDWFGDNLRRIIKIIRLAKSYNPYLETKGKVKYPQRKRGYNDKGSLSRSFKLGPDLLSKPDLERTEYTEINNTPFYPEWYEREKLEQQSHLMERKRFPDDEN